MTEQKRIPHDEMHATLRTILLRRGFTADRAERCAAIFVENSLDGVYSHGVNRFPMFIEMIEKKRIDVRAVAECIARVGALEQWHGRSGPGPLNAWQSTARALELAREHGVGCVALSHTNHWMRGGAYGWQAATEGFAFMAWTNTLPNMPAWHAENIRLGNNPLVLAAPKREGAVVLDMALSQFSYGKLESYARVNRALPVPGGYDRDGNLTRESKDIVDSQRALPIGYWKGTGLSLLLDLLASVLSGGLATHQIGAQESEYDVSQVFIAIDLGRLPNSDSILQTVEEIIRDYKASQPSSDEAEIVYPGERALKTRAQNLAHGIEVDHAIWARIEELKIQRKTDD